jgi:hypothetical protein
VIPPCNNPLTNLSRNISTQPAFSAGFCLKPKTGVKATNSTPRLPQQGGIPIMTQNRICSIALSAMLLGFLVATPGRAEDNRDSGRFQVAGLFKPEAISEAAVKKLPKGTLMETVFDQFGQPAQHKQTRTTRWLTYKLQRGSLVLRFENGGFAGYKVVK